MEQTISIQNRLRPDEGQAYLLPIAVASETLSTTSASKINVRDEGLTVLSDSANPVADIVFIHGIQGHPRMTWTYAVHPAKQKSKLSKILGYKKNSSNISVQDSSQDSVYWPEDLLSKDFEDVRILTYGYDSQVSHFFKGPANQNNINAHGRSLLNALELYRRQDPRRRLIFIVHSLGGLILKEALRRSKRASDEDQDLRNIYQSLHAIVFFGTPHRGSPYAELGITAQQIAKAIGFDANDALLRNLSPDGEHLELLREEFACMLDERTFKVYSFQEGQGFKGTHALSRKIVDDASSSLDHPVERKDFINANHMMMCRFRSSDDDGYIKVKGVISKYLGEIQEMRFQERQRLDDEHVKLLRDCLKSLKTVAMRERRDEIEIAHPHTFDWVFSNTKSGFYDWIKGDGGLFWIKGKPASGKSTLMKYILEDKRTREALHEKYGRNSLTMPAFFFHDRGINLTQKSLDGLLRSILYQILTDLPALIDCVSEVYGITMENQGHCAWRLSESKKALNAIVQQTKISGCIVLFIDALDEFVGTDIEIARFLTDLLLYQNEQALRIRICASSRPHNVFYDMFGEFPGLAIHDWTQKDIDIYTFDKLGQCKREGLEDLHKEITSRAQGVFLWVRLVIEELSGPLFDGEPIPSLVARLSELPDDLSAFYRLMLEKLPQDKRPVAVRMMELVLCSRNRISLVIFTAAVNLPGHGVSPADRLKQGPLDILRSCEEMVRQIRSFSGGLLEVVQTQKQFRERVPEWLYSPLKRSQYDFTRQYVQLLHQTAKEFVNNPSNSDMMSGKSARESALAGHLRLMEAYTNIAQIGKPTLWSSYEIGKPALWSSYNTHKRIPKERPPNYGVVHTDLVLSFYSNALYAEYLSSKPNVELVAEFHNTLCAHCGQNWPSEWLGHATTHEDFPVPYAAFTSPLALAILHGLYYYAREALFDHHFMSDKERLGLLLYWACLEAQVAYSTIKFESHPYHIFANSLPRGLQIWSLLLENGANPNTRVALHYAGYVRRRRIEVEGSRSIEDEEMTVEERIEEDGTGSVIDEEVDAEERTAEDCEYDVGMVHIEDSIEWSQTSHETNADMEMNSSSILDSERYVGSIGSSNRDLVEGDMEISILHFVLGLDVHLRCYRGDHRSDISNLLEIIRLLVQFGADVNEKALTTLWLCGCLGPYISTPESQSALHYLICWFSGPYNLFEKNSLGPVRSQVIKEFLEHGADPNAIDSNGRTVLECALPNCPYDVIEMILEKGAKITPRLVSESGIPKRHDDFNFMGKSVSGSSAGTLGSRTRIEDDLETPHLPAGAILDEMRWRRPEYYTDEARELARPHNPHWAELEQTEKATARMGLISRLRALVRLD